DEEISSNLLLRPSCEGRYSFTSDLGGGGGGVRPQIIPKVFYKILTSLGHRRFFLTVLFLPKALPLTLTWFLCFFFFYILCLNSWSHNQEQNRTDLWLFSRDISAAPEPDRATEVVLTNSSQI
uniref:Uncharacterized protein n=1 Tax=Oryzias latipes TaxID=8090 RepID=A0A3B3IA34_ORYLA